LSEQKLVDCDKSSYGCDGGFMDYAVKYVLKQGVWPLEGEYPYTAKTESCKGI